MDSKEQNLAPAIRTVSISVQEQESINILKPESKSKPGDDKETDDSYEGKGYPFAVVLRIRVLQIVCGISSMIMGTVGFIEERGQINLGLSIPAGAVTVIAAGASIHTSRGFDGYKPPSCASTSALSRLRFLGSSLSVGAPLTFAWLAALALHVALCVLSCGTLAREQGIAVNQQKFPDDAIGRGTSGAEDEEWNMRAMAAIILILSIITILSAVTQLRIDCLYDPD